MNPFLLAFLLAAAPASAQKKDHGALASLFAGIDAFLNGPVKRSPRVAGVAAVRGGIPTDQGEDLDQRLLDRARVLRAALLRPDASAGAARQAAAVYDALSASQGVQTLAVAGAGADARREAAADLAEWARARRDPPLPSAVKALLTGPAGKIDDKALVSAGWGAYARTLAPAGDSQPDAKTGWSAPADAAKLDEALKSVRDSMLQTKLSPDDEARAHLLAARILRALAQADLRGRADAAAAASTLAPAAAPESGPAPESAAAVPFEPRAIYQTASKSVALIVCASPEGSGELGTGSVVDAGKRLILTNAHVVIRDATKEPWPVVRVYFKPARMTGDAKQDMREPRDGRVVAFDRALDLALVQLDDLPAGAGAIGLDDPRAVDVGDRVAAIGHPEQGGLWTLTTGVISTLVADIGGVKGKDAFQTDTSINRGNSGGPLLDARGRIVGVNTSMSRKAADGLAITSVNFAIRSDVVRRWMAARSFPVAYGGAPAREAPEAAEVALAEPPRSVPLVPPAPAALPSRTAHPVERPVPPPKVTIAEGRPFDRDDLIAAEIAKMEELGEEMHKEIHKKLGR
ncbi:MAG: trypsin-like peptidase domain-containing protein [Elusimicrobia bacterium]|nr:trypsin-like peptidase domain-containing protein [Elusimicrobiota bacterium]